LHDYLESRTPTILDVIAVTVGGWLTVTLFPGLMSMALISDLPYDVAEQSQPSSTTPVTDQSIVTLDRAAPAWLATYPDYLEWAAHASHYAAFATAENGIHGWVNGYNHPQMAADTALAFCQRNTDSPCRVVARSGPRTPIDSLAVPMSATVHAEARQTALAWCRHYISDRDADLPPVTCRLVEWRKRDIQRSQ